METFDLKLVECKINYKYYCDWCGKQIYPNKIGSRDTTSIERESGSFYPESSIGTRYTVDLCSDCSTKLFNYLIDNKCKIQEKEIDY